MRLSIQKPAFRFSLKGTCHTKARFCDANKENPLRVLLS